MPASSPVSTELAATIKRELQIMPLRRVQEMHPTIRPGSIQAIKYGSAHASVAPVGPVAGPRSARGRPTPAAKAFSFSRSERVPKVLRPEEREAYEEQLKAQRLDDAAAAIEARAALKLEHLRQPYLVQISVVVGLEAAEDDSLLADAAEAAARQVLGMRGKNRAWAVDSIERVR